MPEEEVDPKPQSDPAPADEASEQAKSAAKEAKQSESAEAAKEAKKPAAKDANEEPDGKTTDKKPTAKDTDTDTDTEKKSDSKTADKKSTAKDKDTEKKSGSKVDKKSDSKTADKKKKKDKPPPVEEKPFADFIQQDYMPALKAAFAEKQLEDLELTFDGTQVKGDWSQGNKEFIVYFPKEDIKETKAFSVAMAGRQPSTIEPFLIDERRINLDLLVFGVIQRLNGQKWFGDN